MSDLFVFFFKQASYFIARQNVVLVGPWRRCTVARGNSSLDIPMDSSVYKQRAECACRGGVDCCCPVHRACACLSRGMCHSTGKSWKRLLIHMASTTTLPWHPGTPSAQQVVAHWSSQRGPVIAAVANMGEPSGGRRIASFRRSSHQADAPSSSVGGH